MSGDIFDLWNAQIQTLNQNFLSQEMHLGISNINNPMQNYHGQCAQRFNIRLKRSKK